MLRLWTAAPWHDLSQPISSFHHCCYASKSFAPARPITSSLADYAVLHTRTPKVVLKKGKTQLFKSGNPMVYSGAVDRIIGKPPPETGDAVLVTDGAMHPIAWGLYNSVSMFSVRIMEMEDEVSRQEFLIYVRYGKALEVKSSFCTGSTCTPRTPHKSYECLPPCK